MGGGGLLHGSTNCGATDIPTLIYSTCTCSLVINTLICYQCLGTNEKMRSRIVCDVL